MRILMVGTFPFPDGGGGAGRALHMQAKGLVMAGNEVLVATCLGSLGRKVNVFDGIKVKSFCNSTINNNGLLAKISWIKGQIAILGYLIYQVLTCRNDSIVFYGAAPAFAVVALLGKAMKQHTCFVQGDLMDSLNRSLLVYAERILAKNVSLILIGGSYLLERRMNEISPTTKCLRLWPPTDTDFYASGRAVSAKKMLNFGDSIIIAYVGAVSSLEGVDKLIRSFAYVVSKHPEVMLVIAGPRLEHDPIMGTPIDYQAVVESLELKDKVVFTGLLRMSEVADLLAAAAVLVNPKVDHPANRVAAPIKIGEYLASGSPVLTTRICELDEWLVDRRDVLFCKSDDPVALVEGICEILDDDDLSKCLARHGPKAARRVCDYREWGKRVTEAIEKSDSKVHKMN